MQPGIFSYLLDPSSDTEGEYCKPENGVESKYLKMDSTPIGSSAEISYIHSVSLPINLTISSGHDALTVLPDLAV